MAALGSQTIAASYEQLLHVDTDGGGATTTLVPVKDGDNGTTFCLQLATTKAMIEGNASTLYFYDEGGESISADNAGILSIAGGAEIDITTPTVDINASTAVTVDGPATTFVESIAYNIPSICIWNTEIFQVKDEHKELFSSLRRAGIICINHKEFVFNANKFIVNKDYWLSSEVQIARNNFLKFMAFFSDDWKGDLQRAFSLIKDDNEKLGVNR